MKKLLTKFFLDQALRNGLANADITKHFHSPSFCGVFSSDEEYRFKHAIKSKQKNMAWQDGEFISCILNLSKKNTQGSHFVCLIVYPYQKMVYYLDPTGLPPFQFFIEKLLYHTLELNCVLYNYVRFQKLGSNLCAYYCMYFILLYQAVKDGKTELIDQLKPYSENTEQNKQDQILVKNLRILLNNKQ